jgi:molybdate transport system ATP-binding protein
MADELICRCRKQRATGFAVEADLRIPLGQSPVTVLFGPSGSGKTTLLRLIAGLERADSGEIRFRGQPWFDSASGLHLPPQRRRAGFLFQDYALFPHLTVAQNVGYAARPGKGRELLEAFGLGELAARRPREISGGQQQRVALARALAAEPALLLLDEPLSALDEATRARTRGELRRLLLASGVPSLLVTHDRIEAASLGDWMAVIVDGRVRQTGPVADVFRRPADPEAAAAVGMENVLPARVERREGGLLTLRVGTAALECVDRGEVPGDGPVWAYLRAEDVSLTRQPPSTSARNCLPARVTSVAAHGPLARVDLDCGFSLAALITSQSAAEMRLAPGEIVYAIVKAAAVHLTT